MSLARLSIGSPNLDYTAPQRRRRAVLLFVITAIVTAALNFLAQLISLVGILYLAIGTDQSRIPVDVVKWTFLIAGFPLIYVVKGILDLPVWVAKTFMLGNSLLWGMVVAALVLVIRSLVAKRASRHDPASGS